MCVNLLYRVTTLFFNTIIEKNVVNKQELKHAKVDLALANMNDYETK